MSNLKKKYRLDPIAYDEVSLVDSGAAQDAHVLIFKRDSECGKPNSSTGAKDGKSKRSKNFKEERHPRDEKGRMKESSKESKEKYGKDGTTKESLERECREGKRTKDGKKRKRPKPVGQITSDPEGQREIRRRRRRRRQQVEKSMTTWAQDAQVRAILERKAPHGN